MHWRRKWQPTPVFLPGESQGQGSLVGCCLWGRTESDTTEVTQHSIYMKHTCISFIGIYIDHQYIHYHQYISIHTDSYIFISMFSRIYNYIFIYSSPIEVYIYFSHESQNFKMKQYQEIYFPVLKWVFQRIKINIRNNENNRVVENCFVNT